MKNVEVEKLRNRKYEEGDESEIQGLIKEQKESSSIK